LLGGVGERLTASFEKMLVGAGRILNCTAMRRNARVRLNRLAIRGVVRRCSS